MGRRFLEKIMRVEENFMREETNKQVAQKEEVNLEEEYLSLESKVKVENRNLDAIGVESEPICNGNAHKILQCGKGVQIWLNLERRM